MYKISKLTGNIYFNSILVPLDDTNQLWQDYWVFIQGGGSLIEIEATPEEITEANKPKVPESISRMNLKIQLLLRNIEIQEIEDTINSIPDFMFPEVAKKISIIKFNEAVTFDRYNADLNLIATLMGLSQEDLDEIFINGNI
jgi:hypothetical protein